MIALGGIAFAVFLYTRLEKKERPVPAAVPPPMTGGATYESVMSPGFKQIRYKDGKEVSALSYAKATQFSDGRQIIEKPRFEGDRDGRPFVITADRGELKAPAPNADPNQVPEETHLLGNVVMQEKDGIGIKTEDATYRESVGTLEIPGDMAFTDGRVSGAGLGAIYDRIGNVLTLKDKASVNIAPDESGFGRLDSSATTMLVNRATHFVSLDGNARIGRDKETLTAASAQMHLSEDNQGVQLMELRQNAAIVPVAGQGKSSPEMRAEDINLEFLPDGRTIKRAQMVRKATLVISGDTGGRKQITGDLLDVLLGSDGQTVTNLAGNGGPVVVTLPASADTPQRTIRGRQLDASGDGTKGLSSAVFRQNVEFVENRAAARGQAAARRTVSARQLTLMLDGGDLSNIKEARFREAVTFVDGDTSGAADDVTYRAAAGRLALRSTGAASTAPNVKTARIRVDAREIDIDLNKIVIDAKGQVTTRTIPDKSKASTVQGLFDDAKEMLGRANEFGYDDEKKAVAYIGAVLLIQGTGKEMSRIQADKVSLDDASGDMVAEGNVVSVFPISNMETSGAGGPKATAAKLEYRGAKHSALFTGTTVARAQLNSPDGIIRGVTIELQLADDGHELARMIVEKNVEARVSADRTARGSKMVHDAKAGTYDLSGDGAKVIRRTVEKGVESCEATQGSSMTFSKAAGNKQTGNFSVQDPVGAGTTSLNLKTCAEWIIK
jgi:lipopolysaccharide export system protein LptA